MSTIRTRLEDVITDPEDPLDLMVLSIHEAVEVIEETCAFPPSTTTISLSEGQPHHLEQT